MKKSLYCVVAVLAVATFGLALIHCGGGGDDKECTSNADCVAAHGDGWYCDHTVSKCKDGGCTPNCDGKDCGDDGCGGSCGTCDAGETCNAAGLCEGCTPDCAKDASARAARSVMPCSAAEARTSFRISVQILCM